MNRPTHKFFFCPLILAGLLLAACERTPPKTFTIGVVNVSRTMDPILDGFKAKMAELGYVEGENVTYVYEGVVTSIDGLNAAVQNLMAVDLDLIFSMSTPATLAVKKAVERTDIPVVFAPVTDPVKSDLVERLTKPGGNLTGVRVGGFSAKELEWLLAIAPGTARLFVPYNPEDNASVQGMEELSEAATTLGVELVSTKVRTSQDLVAALDVVPEYVDAIFLLGSGFLNKHVTRFVETAIERRLPLVSACPCYGRGVLLSYGHNYYRDGEQAGRLAYNILRGIAPADLPVETADFFLGINLRTAQAIGLDIPDDILKQAKFIVR